MDLKEAVEYARWIESAENASRVFDDKTKDTFAVLLDFATRAADDLLRSQRGFAVKERRVLLDEAREAGLIDG